MGKLIITFLFSILFFHGLFAQQAGIKGVVTDTSSGINLTNTVIALLKPDSVLYSYTRSKSDGSFVIEHADSGQYILLVTQNRYADFVDRIELQQGVKNIGKIMMTLKANLLQDVVVRQKIAAMRMRGDTLEYNADSFQVKEGATVEEMLRILPGIQVDKNGNITAQGEKVNKVMVDGEEFFGDDPTIATRNLQANAIDKVQVFDKKSDQAEFSGIDDGQKTKTINLTLKEDKKKGYFGKVELSGGPGDKWNNSAMLNDFKGKKKFSGFGIMSNTGRTGLNWEEQNSYGSQSSSVEFNEDLGGIMIWSNDDEFSSSSFRGEGLPKSWSTGVNYSDKFNNDKQTLNGNVRLYKLNSLGASNTFSQSVLPDSLFYNTQSSHTFSSKTRSSAGLNYEWKIDSFTSIKFTASAYKGTASSNSSYLSEALNDIKNPVNQSSRSTLLSGDNNNLNANLLIRKKYRKAGRTFSLNINQETSNREQNGFLFALNSFYDENGNIFLRDSVDQNKLNDYHTSAFNAKASYTEPIIKNVFADISYAPAITNSEAKRFTFEKNEDDKYNILNDTFSNQYIFNVLTHTGGAGLKYNGKKIVAGAGTNIARTTFNQQNVLQQNKETRKYTNFFPRANFIYKFSQSSRFSVFYNGQSQQPSIEQIQPIADNTNPLIIRIGNPDLKQEFRNNIDFNFNTYKVFSQSGMYAYGSLSTTANQIVTSTATDTLGRTIYRYINSDGNFNFYSSLYYFKKLKKTGIDINTGVNYNNSRYVNFINDQLNQTNNNNIGINVGANKNKEKKYNASYNGNIDYNTTTSSVNAAAKTNYFIQNHNFDATVYLPWKLELNNSVEIEIRQKTELFSNNNNLVLWNGYFGKKVFKDDKGIIKFVAHDILDQNRGYMRNANTNVVSETRYTSIGRFFLLSFTYNFSKTAAEVKPQAAE